MYAKTPTLSGRVQIEVSADAIIGRNGFLINGRTWAHLQQFSYCK